MKNRRVSLIACGPLASGKRAFAGSVRDLLRSRAGEDVTGTAGKTGALFLYAATADAAATAQDVAREVLAQQGLVAEIRLEPVGPVEPGLAAAPRCCGCR